MATYVENVRGPGQKQRPGVVISDPYLFMNAPASRLPRSLRYRYRSDLTCLLHAKEIDVAGVQSISMHAHDDESIMLGENVMGVDCRYVKHAR